VMLVGCCATNTPRKNWGLCFETVAKLVDRGVNAILWAHTDSFYKAYDFLNLTESFGLNNRVLPTKHYLSSDKLAWAYSACDVTLGIGDGEGWGLPMMESLACRVPVVHSNYAGGTEFVPPNMLVDPLWWYHEGLYCHKRPVHDAREWAARAFDLAGKPASLDPKFHWDNCWASWESWLKAGL